MNYQHESRLIRIIRHLVLLAIGLEALSPELSLFSQRFLLQESMINIVGNFVGCVIVASPYYLLAFLSLWLRGQLLILVLLFSMLLCWQAWASYSETFARTTVQQGASFVYAGVMIVQLAFLALFSVVALPLNRLITIIYPR